MEKELSKDNDEVFAIESFGSNKKILISEININNIADYLYMLDCWEISLTKAGVNYLIKEMGVDLLIDTVFVEVEKGVDYKNKHRDSIKNWLEQEFDKAI